MFWADRLVREIQERPRVQSATQETPVIIRDEKTLSGRVHVGSMRGLAIHGLISEVLSEQGVPNRFLWEHNDFDPFDAIPGYLDEAVFKEHLGKPLYAVPSPVEGYENYALYFGAEFQAVHKKIGFTPEYYFAYNDLYKAGKMDALIRTALTRAADIRRILKEVSGSVKEDSWLPVSVVCEQCGKMMTTRAHDFDGDTVAYTCDRSPDGCVPCGYTGRIAPFGGTAKLYWKVEWAAKWVALNVEVEGAGKDHSTKGGSRDVSKRIAKEVFGYDEPYNAPYEFFLVGGKKMSSSKGRGSSAKDMGELLPPEVFRLALLGKEINQQVDVDPGGDSVPRLYDLYDELTEKVRQGVADDFTRLFALIQLPQYQATPPTPWTMRFSEVAFIAQMPHIELVEEAARVKGENLTEEELSALATRAEYAKYWLATYAPERYLYILQETLPQVALSQTQKQALTLLHTYLKEGARSGEELHHRLHELKAEVPIEPKELFSALYQIFLARESGPKAGWFLSVLPHDFVLKRLEEAVA